MLRRLRRMAALQVRRARVIGLMRKGFLIFQVRLVWGLATRLACCSLRSSVSTARKPFPKGLCEPAPRLSTLVCANATCLPVKLKVEPLVHKP